MEIGFFIEHDPTGQPYLGLMVSAPGMQASYVLAYKAGANELLSGVSKAVNDLKATHRKLIAAEGTLNGTRNA